MHAVGSEPGTPVFERADTFHAFECAPTVVEYKRKQTLWPLVRERTIPTDRPPLVDEI
jgi:hypothetical protein